MIFEKEINNIISILINLDKHVSNRNVISTILKYQAKSESSLLIIKDATNSIIDLHKNIATHPADMQMHILVNIPTIIENLIKIDQEYNENIIIENEHSKPYANKVFVLSTISAKLSSLYLSITISELISKKNNNEILYSSLEKDFNKSINLLKHDLNEKLSIVVNDATDKAFKGYSKHWANMEEKLNDSKLRLLKDIEELGGNINKQEQHLILEQKQRIKTTEETLNNKIIEINTILRSASEQVRANNYDTNAQIERTSANHLRFGSIFFMLCITVIAGWSFYDSVDGTLNPTQFFIRFSIVLILSIPAIYLSRESTKHRVQSYWYEQNSIDIKTVDSFVNTLEKEDQDKIKSNLASRLFAGNNLATSSQESYPISIQELIHKVLDKVPTPTNTATDKTKATKEKATKEKAAKEKATEDETAEA